MKRKIKSKNIAVLIIVFALIGYCCYIKAYKDNVIRHEMFPASMFNIIKYESKIDKDHDGIDDQTDILNSVRDYIATKPVYKSKYYATGYPDDGYGVCTDVIAQGLLGAGYDLQLLVDTDRRLFPQYYADEPIDPNIDFRRVRNLLTYLKRNSIELTTDIYDLDKWQGGDIVVFKGHIGIVSDMRNKNGVAFVIHHGSASQLDYEQDILETKKDEIVGHFRIS